MLSKPGVALRARCCWLRVFGVSARCGMRKPNTRPHQSLRQTQAGSLLVLDVAGEASCPPYGRFWDGPVPTLFQVDRVTMQPLVTRCTTQCRLPAVEVPRNGHRHETFVDLRVMSPI